MYNIYSIVILILFDIPRFSVNYLHQIQVAAPSPSSRKMSGVVVPSVHGVKPFGAVYINKNWTPGLSINHETVGPTPPPFRGLLLQ